MTEILRRIISLPDLIEAIGLPREGHVVLDVRSLGFQLGGQHDKAMNDCRQHSLTEEPDQCPETEGCRTHPEEPHKGTSDQTDGSERGDMMPSQSAGGEYVHVRESRAKRRAATGVHELIEAERLVPGQQCHWAGCQEGKVGLEWDDPPAVPCLALFPLSACLGHDEPDEIDDRRNDQDNDRGDQQPRLRNEQHRQYEEVVRDVAAVDRIGDPQVGAVW